MLRLKANFEETSVTRLAFVICDSGHIRYGLSMS
jgi:hypothetical protein